MAIYGPVSAKKPGTSARRCLFGPPDHERIRKDLDRALSEMERSTKASLKAKWGFDVDSETGVPEGRYEYSTVPNTEYIPSYYRKGYTTRSRRVTPRDSSVEMVSASTQLDITTPATTVSSSTQAGQGVDSTAASARTLTASVRKLDFKENCAKSGSTTTSSQRSRTPRSNSAHSFLQSTMTDHYQPRKRRSPDCESSLPRGKSPRL